jgi:2-polyprenyl-3-methyl-5-hydroxy-6-metoxy-1,4-benzoquinol methylase
MELLSNCPVCNNNKFSEFLQCKDHFLSKETFFILKCENCGLLFTNPRPDKKTIGQYYKSNQYISHSNTRKGIVNRIYHFVRSLNHRTKYKSISKIKSEGEILDIGCATGEFLAYFKKRGWKITGIEPDSDARKYAQNNYCLDVFPEDEIQSLGEKRFDVITLWHVLEHVPELNRRIQELYRLLKDDGILIIAVPNASSYDANHFGTYWAGYDVPRHLYHFNKEVIGRLFKKHHFICSDILPMKFDSFYISLLSEKYLSGKNKYFKAINTGIKSNCYARRNENNYSSLIFVLEKEKTEF